MFLSVRELKQWLQITAFEIAMLLTATIAFVILLALKIEDDIDSTWWMVFSPLFACDTLIAYFDLIVFIHLYMAEEKTLAVKRVMINTAIILLLVIYKVLLCQQLEGTRSMKYSAIHSPLFILMFFLLIRSCIVANN